MTEVKNLFQKMEENVSGNLLGHLLLWEITGENFAANRADMLAAAKNWGVSDKDLPSPLSVKRAFKRAIQKISATNKGTKFVQIIDDEASGVVVAYPATLSKESIEAISRCANGDESRLMDSIENDAALHGVAFFRLDKVKESVSCSTSIWSDSFLSAYAESGGAYTLTDVRTLCNSLLRWHGSAVRFLRSAGGIYQVLSHKTEDMNRIIGFAEEISAKSNGSVSYARVPLIETTETLTAARVSIQNAVSDELTAMTERAAGILSRMGEGNSVRETTCEKHLSELKMLLLEAETCEQALGFKIEDLQEKASRLREAYEGIKSEINSSLAPSSDVDFDFI